jgi:hypothetical protein
MNFKLLFTSLVLCMSGAYAQTFTENFDGYVAGQFLCSQATNGWATWDGTKGSTKDVKISSAKANTGANSIFFSSIVATGGPQDVVLPFFAGAVKNTGDVTFSMKVFVPSAKGAYFNFQGSATLGSSAPINVGFSHDGNVEVSGGGNTFINTTFNQDQWIDVKLVGKLNSSSWEFFLNNTTRGKFSVSDIGLWGLDLFPVNTAANTNNQSAFYIDDVSVVYTAFTPVGRNAGLAKLNSPGILSNTISTPTVLVRNLGATAITSFDVSTVYNGITKKTSFTGQNITSTNSSQVNLGAINVVGGTNTITATISNVNGTATDDIATDDATSYTLTAINAAKDKVVVAEEATGTWCQWCPRGAVMMDNLDNKYGESFLGIAVHNKTSDPMLNSIYDAGMATLGVTGYPSGAVDRAKIEDPLNFETSFKARITIAPTAKMNIHGSFDAGTGIVTATVRTEILKSAIGAYKLACVLIEDSVTGTSSGYIQQNAYAGGGSGVMGGFELLPAAVPANKMTYRDVGREILPSFAGKADAYPTTLTKGQVFYTTFTFNVPATYKQKYLKIGSLFIDPAGKIDNGGKKSFAKLGIADTTAASVGVLIETNKFILYPNPSNDVSYIEMGMDNAKDVEISIINANGQIIAKNTYPILSVMDALPIFTSKMPKGIYMVQVKVNGEVETKKLIVE